MHVCSGGDTVVQVALEGYAAALACGTPYDTRAVLRLVQLWLAHSADGDVCDSLQAALKVRRPAPRIARLFGLIFSI